MATSQDITIIRENGKARFVLDGFTYEIKLIHTEKQCSKCREVKPLEMFNNDKSKPSGKSSYCKPCVTQATIASDMRKKQRRMLQKSIVTTEAC